MLTKKLIRFLIKKYNHSFEEAKKLHEENKELHKKVKKLTKENEDLKLTIRQLEEMDSFS